VRSPVTLRTVVTALAVLALGGCGGEAAPAGPTVDVTITDTTFAPAEVSVPAGATVRWTSSSRTERHNIIPVVDGSFTEHKNLIKPGESVTSRFSKPGDYAYYCQIHGSPTTGQRGVVRVTAAA
jgi:plastocyanin